MAKREYVEANKRWLKAVRNKYISILLGIFILISCSQQSKDKNITKEMLYGKWELVGGERQVDYPNIEFFADSTAMLYSQADTLYRFSFYIENDSLYLVDIYGKKYVNRIKLLNDNTVVFDGLADVDKEQTYRRRMFAPKSLF